MEANHHAPLLLCIVSLCFPETHSQMCSNLNNFPQLHHSVVNHGDTFLTLTTPGLMHCARECLVRSLCKSFNFNLTASTCDLNKLKISNLTQEVAGQEIVSSDVDPWPTATAGFCSGHSCGLDQVCVPKEGGNPPYDCATQCLQLPEIEHGTFDLSQTSRDPGTTLKMECDLGFIASGDTLCGENGTWGHVSCDRGCLQPPAIPNAIMKSPQQHIWEQGSILNYVCSPEYTFVGVRMCLDDGRWSLAYCGQSMQSCIDVKNCNSTYDNGEYWLSSTAVNNSLIKIYCHDMTTPTPREYITLNPDTNTLDYRGDPCAWSPMGACDEILKFTKVRISNVIGMVLERNDLKDPIFTLPQNSQCWKQYGGMEDCSQRCPNPAEHSRNISVDTRGTGLIVSPDTVWVHNEKTGVGHLTEIRTNGGRTISIVCSLTCNWCFPTNDVIILELDTHFQPEEDSAILPSCTTVFG